MNDNHLGPHHQARPALRGCLLDGRTDLCVDNFPESREGRKGNGKADIGNGSVQAGIAEAEFSNANAEFRNGKALIGNAVSGL
ncbi:hypothetical protein [Hoeflea sp. BAL378]|uniref:hypothetical protein n=1 Tax=Hoeflea sp. BAL378 TaxID=1547437 RepID=UPI001269D347|nr:hypothetical protein [Hoeflea sp. BAL378]